MKNLESFQNFLCTSTAHARALVDTHTHALASFLYGIIVAHACFVPEPHGAHGKRWLIYCSH